MVVRLSYVASNPTIGSALALLETIFLQLHLPGIPIQHIGYGTPRVRVLVRPHRVSSFTSDSIGGQFRIRALRRRALSRTYHAHHQSEGPSRYRTRKMAWL